MTPEDKMNWVHAHGEGVRHMQSQTHVYQIRWVSYNQTSLIGKGNTVDEMYNEVYDILKEALYEEILHSGA